MIIDCDSADQTVTEKLELAADLVDQVASVLDEQVALKGCELAEYMRDNMFHVAEELTFTAKTIKGENK